MGPLHEETATLQSQDVESDTVTWALDDFLRYTGSTCSSNKSGSSLLGSLIPHVYSDAVHFVNGKALRGVLQQHAPDKVAQLVRSACH